MAAFSTSLSISHAVIGLGFIDFEQTSSQQKCELMSASRGQHNVVGSRPRKVSATRLLVQNSNGPSEDSVVTSVRMSGGDARKAAASQIISLSSKQAGAPAEATLFFLSEWLFVSVLRRKGDLGPLYIVQLGLMLEDEGRPKLLRKLSEANQYIRHLQHELQAKEYTLLDTASELSAMEMELQTLVHVAQEINRQGIKPGTRKINGRYIHSHLASRLEEIQKILHERIKDADQVRTRGVDLVYYGMAEDVQVMGSFDGWTRGEQMSPESTGTFTKFTTTIKLRPGRYEIKFLVDGEWHMSSDLPTVGEGLTMNNLLIVDRF